MRQFAGFGTPEETNERYKQLLKAGGTGLSVAFDLPTLMGRDPDHPLSLGEVGKCGVSIVSLADMERLFDGISLGDITTSMTINSPAPMIFAMYLVVAEKQGADWKKLSGTIQNDILKEFIAQKDTSTRRGRRCGSSPTCSRSARKGGPALEHDLGQRLSHPRSGLDGAAGAGLHAARRDRIRPRYGIDAGLDVDDFVPRISFFFNAHSDFFEEIAKYRAARKLWAEVMRDRFGAKNERSWKLRFHTQTAGVSLTAQQPYNNVVRTGAAGARRRARRHELAAHQLAGRGARAADRRSGDAGAPHAADHRARERRREHRRSARRLVIRRELTLEMEEGASRYFDTIDRMGGMVEAIERGYPQKEIAEASYQFQQAVERREKIIVGVNDFVKEDEPPIPSSISTRPRPRRSWPRSTALQDARDAARSAKALDALREAARGTGNTMYPLLDCVRAYATVGEMCDALRDVWGEYEEVPLDLSVP